MLQQLKDFLRFMGRRGVVLVSIGWIFSFLLAGIEYCLAAFLVVFLFTLNLVDAPRLPPWLPYDPSQLSATVVWGSLFLIGLFQAVFQIVVYQSKIMLTEGAHARMRMILGYKLLQSEERRYLPLSEVNLYTAEFFPKATSFIFYATQVMSSFIQAGAIAAGMLFLAPREATIGLAGLGLMAFIVLCLNRLTNRAARKVPEAREVLERSQVRITRNWLLIKILRIHDREYEDYLRPVNSYYRHSAIAYFFGNLGGAAMPVFGILLIAVIVTASVRLFHTPAASLLGFLYLFVRFQQMVANGSHLIGGLFTYRSQLEKTRALVFSLPTEERKKALEPAGELTLFGKRTSFQRFRQNRWEIGSDSSCSSCPPSVDVQGVSFSWPGMATPAFSKLCFTVDPGSSLGIVGPNGCGKSTLLSIILGAMRPSEGSVLIGGREGVEYVKKCSDSIAYVGPEPYLIRGTIRDNLIYGIRREYQEDDLWRALEMVRLDEFVRSMPQGIEYQIEENGDGLSSGQKQRISIARAFLRQPSLLVMDEPSANLDDATEDEILRRLREFKGRCTVLLVSHKPGILLNVDRTLHLDDWCMPAGPIRREISNGPSERRATG